MMTCDGHCSLTEILSRASENVTNGMAGAFGELKKLSNAAVSYGVVSQSMAMMRIHGQHLNSSLSLSVLLCLGDLDMAANAESSV